MRADVAAGALIAALACWAAGIAAATLPWGRAARILSGGLSAAGCAAIAICGGAALGIDHGYRLGTWQEVGAVSLRLDGVAGFYLLLTGVVGGAISVAYAMSRARASGFGGRAELFALNGLLGAVAGIFISANVFLFVLCWESMAILFYLSIGPDRDDPKRSALWTMDLSKLGTACILAGFLVLFGEVHSFQFADLARLGGTIGAIPRSVVFVLFVVGFGVKAGTLPVQVWLPRAYPKAPGLMAALLAAVVFNVAFYGIERTLFELVGTPLLWWGIALVLTGGLSAFGGILYAASQTNIKAFLAYSSMENTGFILAAFGIALLGRAEGLPLLSGVGLIAALYQITVHACTKALLFIETNSVEEACGDTNMERLGGLVRPLPVASLLFLGGAATFAAVPPLGGLTSEWLIIESLMQGFRIGGTAAGVAMAVTGALLALTSGIAIVAFVKLFAITFLGTNRGATPRPTREASAFAGVPLAAACLGLGVGAPWFARLLGGVASAAAHHNAANDVSPGKLLIQPAFSGFSSVSPTQMGIVLSIGAAIVVAFLLVTMNRRQSRRRVPVWNSGSAPFSQHTQYTALGFSNPLRLVFGKLLLPAREVAAHGWFPLGGTYTTTSRLLLEEYVYDPIIRFGLWTNGQARRLQSGSLSLYLLYFLAGLTLVLILVPLVH